MGKDKRLVEIGGVSLFRRSLDVLTGVFEHVIVVIARKDEAFAIEFPYVVEDIIPGCGSAGGIYTGLSYATTDRVFVVACDMPFLNPSLIRYLCNLDSHSDIVMVKLGQKLQPMHAIYSRRCLPVLARMLDDKELKIHTLCTSQELVSTIVPEETIKQWDSHGLSFLNVNTPMDLEFARKVVKGQTRC